jgi:anti-sigma-K factor RskA
VLESGDLITVDLKGQERAAGATGRALWSRSRGLVFTAEGLPALPRDRVYQLWTISGSTPTSAGLLAPDATGHVTFTVAGGAGATRPDAFGVTIEPAGGSATPTLPIVLMGSAPQ